MLGKLFNKRSSRKFKYVPRFYDKHAQNLMGSSITHNRFAEGYIAKRKSNTPKDHWVDEQRIDFKSFKTKTKATEKAVNVNTFIIFAILMLFVFIMWFITNPNISNFFSE